jgi:hypothetical protein
MRRLSLCYSAYVRLFVVYRDLPCFDLFEFGELRVPK